MPIPPHIPADINDAMKLNTFEQDRRVVQRAIDLLCEFNCDDIDIDALNDLSTSIDQLRTLEAALTRQIVDILNGK